jgi:hypothetical protein
VARCGERKNEYIFTDVHWSEVPGRDEAWKAQTIANTQNNNSKLSLNVNS